jgi:hypothetical protein
MFSGLYMFPIRYHESAVVLLSIGLLLLGDALWRHWRERGLLCGGIIMLAYNLGDFIRTTDPGSKRPAFYFEPGRPVLCNVWYMVHKYSLDAVGTLMGPRQWLVLGVLLVSGCSILALGFKSAAKISSQNPGQ